MPYLHSQYIYSSMATKTHSDIIDSTNGSKDIGKSHCNHFHQFVSPYLYHRKYTHTITKPPSKLLVCLTLSTP